MDEIKSFPILIYPDGSTRFVIDTTNNNNVNDNDNIDFNIHIRRHDYIKDNYPLDIFFEESVKPAPGLDDDTDHSCIILHQAVKNYVMTHHRCPHCQTTLRCTHPSHITNCPCVYYNHIYDIPQDISEHTDNMVAMSIPDDMCRQIAPMDATIVDSSFCKIMICIQDQLELAYLQHYRHLEEQGYLKRQLKKVKLKLHGLYSTLP